MGLRVRVPQGSLFHDEKFAFFDFGVRGTPEILKIFSGVSLKILKKVGVLPAAAKVLPAAAQRLRPRGALRAPRDLRRFAAAGNTSTFFKISRETPKKNFKILGVPLTPKYKNANLLSAHSLK